MIVSVSDAPRGGVQVLFGHQKQRSPPLGSSLPWALKCSVTGRCTLSGPGGYNFYKKNSVAVWGWYFKKGKQMWDQYQLVCSKVDTHSTLVCWTEQSRVYCSLDSSKWYLLLVSECELGRLLTYLRTLTNVGKISWQFLLCVSMLTKYSHSAKKESGRDVCVCVCVCVCLLYVGRQSWVSSKGTSQLTNTLGTGLDCMMHESCRLSTMTIASFLCCRSDTSPNRLQKGSLCCLPCK
jgi:hypothetical protein